MIVENLYKRTGKINLWIIDSPALKEFVIFMVIVIPIISVLLLLKNKHKDAKKGDDSRHD